MGTGSANVESENGRAGRTVGNVTLEATPERRLIRPSGSFRHIDFRIRVGGISANTRADRLPLTLALVLDRSGSMQGDKLATAKRAALAVLDRLEARDQAAVVIFDEHIDVLQPPVPMTNSAKDRVRAMLARVQARGTTALHEGWLTGCQAVAAETSSALEHGLARVFLLTDGLANVGVTDPEQIAAEAAGIRERARISTSTFGIGADYNELLLGPMAVAGGGQFHHLRTASEIVNTFVGELDGLMAVVASGVRLELEAHPSVMVDVVSKYWTRPLSAEPARWSVAIGDLMAGEERHAVVRFGFPQYHGEQGHAVRARVVWASEGAECSSEWCETEFTYADHAACDAELRERDASVMHWVGLHHADRAKRQATELNQRGELQRARETLRKVAQRIAEYAGADTELHAALRELRALGHEVAEAPVASLRAKELQYASYLRSRGQIDRRGPSQ